MLQVSLKAAEVKYVLVVALQLDHSLRWAELADAKGALGGLEWGPGSGVVLLWRLSRRHRRWLHREALLAMQRMEFEALGPG